MMMGVGLLNPSDLPSEIAHTASNTPDRTKTSQAIRNIFPPSCLDLVRLPRPGVRADSGADYSKFTAGLRLDQFFGVTGQIAQ